MVGLRRYGRALKLQVVDNADRKFAQHAQQQMQAVAGWTSEARVLYAELAAAAELQARGNSRGSVERSAVERHCRSCKDLAEREMEVLLKWDKLVGETKTPPTVAMHTTAR